MKKLFTLFLTLTTVALAQNINVQADSSSGLLFRPSNFFSNATNIQGITDGVIASIGATTYQPLDADLTSIAGNATGGFLTRTAANTYTPRTLTGTSAEITVTNGDGVAGVPTFSLPTALTFTGKTVTGGTFSSPTLVTPALGTPSSATLTNATGTASGLTAGTATNANNVAITDDTTTNATVFPTWASANTGNLPSKVSSTKFGFNPSTNAFFIGTPSLISTGAAGATPIYQFASAAGETGIGVYNFNNGDANPAILRLFKSNGGTVGTHGAVINGDIVGQVAGYGSDGTDWARVAAIRFIVNGSVSAGAIPGDVVVYTSTANSFNEAARFKSNLNTVLAGSLTTSQTLGIIGTTTNNSASAGSVGEYISASVAQASPIALTTATDTNITSISLTAGDWDVSGQVVFRPNTSTAVVTQIAWISSTSATIPGFDSMAESAQGIPYTSAATYTSVQTPVVRFSLSATTTIYLSARASFSVSTNEAFGSIRARRVR